MNMNLKIIRNVKYILENLNFHVHYDKCRFPLWAGIEITNACNLNCIMCNTKLSKRPIGYMTPEVFESILSQLRKIGINTIGLHTVGEPFMYKNLKKLFKIINKYRFKIELSTNGQFPDRLQELIYLYSFLIKFLRFSIDGAKPETYETIRRGGKFQKLIKSLEMVHKFNRGKINYGIDVKIDSILSMTNIHEIPFFFKVFGKYCWPEKINFGLINGLSPDTKYFWEALPFPNLIRKNVPCEIPFNGVIYFTYDAKITLCCRDYNGELIVGDLNKNSIIEIWNGKDAEFIREQHLNPEKMTNGFCRQCFAPYPFVSSIINNYIHFLHLYYPHLSSHKFGEKILVLLKDLDTAMQNKDKNLVKRSVLKALRN